MKYLFHNVYGDCNELISTSPSDVQCVPFGWTEEIENYRNNLIKQLNIGISSLPSFVFNVPEKMLKTLVDVDGQVEESLIRYDAYNEVIGISNFPKPWNWETINKVSNDIIIADRLYPTDGKLYFWDNNLGEWIKQN